MKYVLRTVTTLQLEFLSYKNSIEFSDEICYVSSLLIESQRITWILQSVEYEFMKTQMNFMRRQKLGTIETCKHVEFNIIYLE